MTLFLCALVGAGVGFACGYELAPRVPDPAVVVSGEDMSRYHAVGDHIPVDTPEWDDPVITKTTFDSNHKAQNLELITRDGKPEYHDYDVRVKNSESITKFVDFLVPIGTAAGLLVAVMITLANRRKQAKIFIESTK
jgi:hypothetical protein